MFIGVHFHILLLTTRDDTYSYTDRWLSIRRKLIDIV